MEFGSARSFIFVALGGAVGSVLRYAASVLFGARAATTFGVNITGAFLIGVLAAATPNTSVRLILGTGVLGGFTTFSAWQLDAVWSLRSRGLTAEPFWILFGSLIIGFLGCKAGYLLGEWLWPTA